jgi:hypothetical protein
MIMMGIIMHQITLTSMPLPLFKTMAQSRRGAPHILTVKEKLALPVLFLASFAVTVYRVGAFTSVGVPLIVQVALSILKPAGSAGATVQLEIAPPKLLKVILVTAL